MNLINRKKISITLILSFQLSFAFLIGISIPSMESNGKYMMVLILFTFLIIFNIILFDKFQFFNLNSDFFTNNNQKKDIPINQNLVLKNKISESDKIERLVLKLNEKVYIFTNRSLIVFIFGSPLLVLSLFLFFGMEINNWLQEIVAKQTVFIFNLIFDLNLQVNYVFESTPYWIIFFPEMDEVFFMSSMCTAAHVFCIYAGIITCIPHSRDLTVKRDIVWRKTKTLILACTTIYVANLIRLIFFFYLSYIGISWKDSHSWINNITGIFAAMIFLIFLYKWLPEFYISINYSFLLIKKRLRKV